MTTKKSPSTRTKTTKPRQAALAQQPTAAPGAIPVGGTDTQEQALATGVVQASGVISKEQAAALAIADLPGVVFTGEPPTAAVFTGEPPTAVVFTGEPPTAAVFTGENPKTPVHDAFGTAKAQAEAQPEPTKRAAAPGMHFAHRVTRLKMTLQSVVDLPGDADNPLTRCTFGAVYSPNPTEEDGVFGKYTPYGQLSYNVRSDLTKALEVGAAYYVDIQKVPS